MNEPRAPRPRHPVVLVHGLLGFTRWALGQTVLAHYFRGIPDRLAGDGVRVVVPELPPTGSIASRAAALVAAIDRDVPGQRVHLVAHSMGGLDARYAISRLGLADRVITLTTLGTPHRGSPVADRATDVAARVGFLGAIRKFGVDTAAFTDLRTDSCAAFNAATPDAPGVVYRSFAGRKSRGDMAPPLRRTFDLIDDAEGANDGLVSVASARWGSVAQVVAADHVDLVGWTPDAPGVLGRPADVGALWAQVTGGLVVAERADRGPAVS